MASYRLSRNPMYAGEAVVLARLGTLLRPCRRLGGAGDRLRRWDGEIPGALVIDRTVVEWRLDPASPARIPEATNHAVRVIVICNQGYSSSLAAASLQELGLVNATDVIGGFAAWKAAGLPVRP